MLKRCFAGLLVAVFFAPSAALAQPPKAGVITTLEGNVSVRRVALPDPVPLKFKDDVFLQDTVATGDRSLARMLLGGKAVVTVRERSVLTVTEVPGRSTIDLESGKFALAVAREKMRPGEEIQIRTPNAIAGVRGTVVITEISRQGAQLTGAPAVVTNFYVLRGSIVAQPLDPGTRQPVGAPVQVGTLQAYSGAGTATPRVVPVPPEQVGQITSGLQPTGPKGGSNAGQEQVKTQAVQTAVTLLTALTGGNGNGGGNGGGQVALATAAPSTSEGTAIATPPTSTTAVIIPPVSEEAPKKLAEDAATKAAEEEKATLAAKAAAEETEEQTEAAAAEETPEEKAAAALKKLLAQIKVTASSLTVAKDTSLITLTGTVDRTDTTPYVELDGATVTASGTAPLVLVDTGGVVTLAGALVRAKNSTITGDAAGLEVKGELTSSHTAAFFDFDHTTLDLEGNAVRLIGKDVKLTLAGPLLEDVSGTISTGGTSTQSMLVVFDGAVLKDTSTDALVSLSSSTLSLTGSFVTVRRSGTAKSTLDLKGPILDASGGSISAKSTVLKDADGAARLCCALFALGQGAILKSATTSALFSLASTSVDADTIFSFFDTTSIFGETTNVAAATATLAGPLVKASGTTSVTSLRDFLGIFRSSLTSTTSDALINLDGATLTLGGTSPIDGTTTAGRLVQLAGNSTGVATSLTLSGPLLSTSGAKITSNNDIIGIFNGASLSSTTTSSLLSITGGSVSSGAGGQFFILSSSSGLSGSTLTLSGPLLSATDTTLKIGTPGTTDAGSPQVFSFQNGATLTSKTTSALVSLSGTKVDAAGNFLDLRTSATATLEGPLLSATNSTVDVTSLGFGSACCNVFRMAQGATLTSNTTSAFISLSSGAKLDAGPDTQSGGAIFSVNASGSTSSESASSNTATFAGPLLSVSSSTVTSLSPTIFVGRSSVTATTTDPLISLTSSTLTSGGTDPFTALVRVAPLLDVTASATSGTSDLASSMTLSGPLLSATGSTITTNTNLISIFNGATLSAAGSTPLVSLTSPTLTVGRTTDNGELIEVSGVGGSGGTTRSKATLATGLLSMTGGTSELTGGYVLGTNGGQVDSTHPSKPLVAIDGGTHKVASNSGTAALRLFGRSANVASEALSTEGVTLTLGTDEPLKHTGSGAFVEVKGSATLTAQSGLQLDTALLAASAPLFEAFGSSTSITSSSHALDLVQKAKLTSVGPVLKLDGSTLTVTTGDLIRVRNGSLLKVTGDFAQLSNGAKINVSDGAFLSVSGGSVVNISGALVNFATAASNQVNVTNSLTPTTGCSSCGPFASQITLTNGATFSNVNISANAIKNNGSGGTFSVTGSAILLEGSTSKITISGN